MSQTPSTNPKDAIGLTKPALRLVPPALMLHVAEAMADGAKKYGPYNWREHPVRLTVYIEAALRHLLALLDGEDRARDSNRLHAGHVAACMAIVLDALETGNLIDDRAKGGVAADIIERHTAKPEPAPAQNIVFKIHIDEAVKAVEGDDAQKALDELVRGLHEALAWEGEPAQIAPSVAPRPVKVGDKIFAGHPSDPETFSGTISRVGNTGESVGETFYLDDDPGGYCLSTASACGWCHEDGTPIADRSEPAKKIATLPGRWADWPQDHVGPV